MATGACFTLDAATGTYQPYVPLPTSGSDSEGAAGAGRGTPAKKEKKAATGILPSQKVGAPCWCPSVALRGKRKAFAVKGG